MEPKIAERKPFRAMGVLARVTPATADFHAIWMNRFMPRHDEVKPRSTDGAYYGVCFCAGKDAIDYVAGMAVENVATVPHGLVLREVPAATDAVFECTVATISQTYGFIHGKSFALHWRGWLGTSDRTARSGLQSSEWPACSLP